MHVVEPTFLVHLGIDVEQDRHLDALAGLGDGRVVALPLDVTDGDRIVAAAAAQLLVGRTDRLGELVGAERLTLPKGWRRMAG